MAEIPVPEAGNMRYTKAIEFFHRELELAQTKVHEMRTSYEASSRDWALYCKQPRREAVEIKAKLKQLRASSSLLRAAKESVDPIVKMIEKNIKHVVSRPCNTICAQVVTIFPLEIRNTIYDNCINWWDRYDPHQHARHRVRIRERGIYHDTLALPRVSYWLKECPETARRSTMEEWLGETFTCELIEAIYSAMV
ncbi:hypothetical protein DE146DRAFT_285270 [Phaeosphaeria sp. MPI-PUGE-AT-0046c]|nr:hypothetical protein DE146DRAFT_285270 [Phaeosphaeria sp. MPI-PUGE-AT-0046c]